MPQDRQQLAKDLDSVAFAVQELQGKWDLLVSVRSSFARIAEALGFRQSEAPVPETPVAAETPASETQEPKAE